MNRNKILGWTAGLAVGLTLLACGGGTKPSEGTATQPEAGVSTPAEAESKKAGPVVAPLGGKGLVFDAEKIDVAIGKPGTYKPSKYMERPAKGSRAFVVTVTVVNNNAEAINLDSLVIAASLGEANADMEPIFDTDAGLKGTPQTALLPGKTVKFKYGFVGPTDEAHPVVNINVNPWELGQTTGLFQGKL